MTAGEWGFLLWAAMFAWVCYSLGCGAERGRVDEALEDGALDEDEADRLRSALRRRAEG